LNNVASQAEGISVNLKSLARDHAFTYHFVSPVWNWIDSVRWSHLDLAEVRSNTDTAATQVGSTIDTMLVDVQGILKAAALNESAEDPATKDRFLTRGLSQVMKCTRSLNLDGITTQLQQLLVVLSGAPRHEAPDAVRYILPFLERYLLFVDNQLTNHHHWTNALFKLTYVSCSIVRRICNDGFCQPLPEGEGHEGEGKESADGVGMGEGTGKENVSDEIKEESQVEGLQDAGEEASTEREKDGDDKAIEMSEDIDGGLEDVEDQGSGEEDDKSGDESEVEDNAQDLDANDPHAVDEKLWGDERGKESKDSDDKLEKDHSSQQEQGNSEVVAKENEGTHKGEKEGDGQAETAETDTPEDVPEGEEEQPGAQGAPIEDRIDETETLNLPEDLQMGEDEVQKGEDSDDFSDGDEGDPEDAAKHDPFQDQEDVSMSEEAARENDEPDANQTGQPGETDAEDPDSNQKPDLTNPDLHGGADQDYNEMVESSADTKEDGQTREESKRTQGGQTGENDEEQTARDV
jgi:midasin